MKKLFSLTMAAVMIYTFTSSPLAANEPAPEEYISSQWQYLTHFEPTNNEPTKHEFTASQDGYYAIGAFSPANNNKAGGFAMSTVYLKANDKLTIDLTYDSTTVPELRLSAGLDKSTGGNEYNVRASSEPQQLKENDFAVKYIGEGTVRSRYGAVGVSQMPMPGCVVIEIMQKSQFDGEYIPNDWAYYSHVDAPAENNMDYVFVAQEAGTYSFSCISGVSPSNGDMRFGGISIYSRYFEKNETVKMTIDNKGSALLSIGVGAMTNGKTYGGNLLNRQSDSDLSKFNNISVIKKYAGSSYEINALDNYEDNIKTGMASNGCIIVERKKSEIIRSPRYVGGQEPVQVLDRPLIEKYPPGAYKDLMYVYLYNLSDFYQGSVVVGTTTYGVYSGFLDGYGFNSSSSYRHTVTSMNKSMYLSYNNRPLHELGNVFTDMYGQVGGKLKYPQGAGFYNMSTVQISPDGLFLVLEISGRSNWEQFLWEFEGNTITDAAFHKNDTWYDMGEMLAVSGPQGESTSISFPGSSSVSIEDGAATMGFFTQMSWSDASHTYLGVRKNSGSSLQNMESFYTRYRQTHMPDVAFKATVNMSYGDTLKVIIAQDLSLFDMTPPSKPTITKSSTDEWSKTNVTITIDGSTDNESGVARYEYKLGTGAWQTYSSPVVLSSSGAITARAVDGAGNTSIETQSSVKIDKVAPTATHKTTPSAWTKGSVEVIITAQDDISGVKEIEQIR